MKHVRTLLLRCMRISLVQAFLSCLFVGISIANDLSAQELLSRRMSINVTDKKVKTVLKEIEKATDAKFSYSPQVIQSGRTVTLHMNNATLGEILERIFVPLNVTFDLTRSQIILKKQHPLPQVATEKAGTEQEALISVSGKVSDENKNPLPGVSVVLKGSNQGTTTDINGDYSLTFNAEEPILTFSYVGYLSQEIVVGDQTKLDVSLQPDNKALKEVVVVGYGTQSKASLTGAVSTVNGDAIASIPSSALSNSLAGRVPGATIINNSGFVGAPSSIQIRGLGTFNGTEPLFVIDGVIQPKAQFDVLDPNEVESISILKDAATASIYGSRGANGVVLIKTKTGKAQKPSFSYSNSFSAQRTTRPLQGYSATEELQYINDQAETFGNPKPVTPEIFDYFKDKSYSILDYIWQNPTSQQHDFSVNGGSESISYYMLAGYNKASGSFKNTDFGRYNFRTNVTAKINDYMSLNVNVSGNQRQSSRFYWPYDASDSYTVADFYRATFNWTRLYPFYVDDAGNPTSDIKNGLAVTNGGWNPIELVENGGYRRLTYRTLNAIGKFDLKIPFIDGLSTSFLYNYNAGDRNTKDLILFNRSYKFQPASTVNKYIPGPVNPDQTNVHNLSSAYDQVAQGALFENSYQLDWFINYDKTFGLHHVTGLAVYEQQKSAGNVLSGSAQDLLSTSVDQIFNASTDRTKRTFDGNETHNSRASYVGRLHYEYSNRYIAEFSFRYDGSFIFPEDKRWGFFPSGSLGWIVSNEKFFKLPVISYLKLRGSAGLLGNDNVAPYQFQNNYRAGSSYVFGGSLYNGITAGTPPNLNITWEKSVTYNGGLDFGLLNGRLNGEVDYFYRHTYDILRSRIRVIPGTYGAGLSSENYAEIDVKGFEAALTYNNKIGDFKYSIGANMGYARDKIVYQDEAAGLVSWRSTIGQPQNRVFGFVSEGIIRDQSAIDALPSGFTQFGRTPMLGTILYKDIRGTDWNSNTPDGKITEYDQVYLSNNAIPRINYGITLGAQWKGISVDALLQGVGAYDRMISTMNGGGVFQTGDRPYFELWTEHWTPSNPNAPYPRAGQWSEEFGPATSTFWMKNGAYMRLRNLNVGYSLPAKWLSPLKIQTCKFFVNGANLFVLSPIKVMDPEQQTLDSYPIMKTFSAGLNITF
jgi:TonB-linked SusC/RagA family outer membrane protein